MLKQYGALLSILGPINTFLSWRIWIPLSRLNFAMYLLHPMIIFLCYLQYKTPMYYTDVSQVSPDVLHRC